MAEAMKKGFEDVQRMVSSYVPPAPVGVTKPIGDEDGFFPFPPEYEASSNTTVPLNPPPSSGDAKQEELENQMVGVTQPTGRRRLRSMGVGKVSGTLPLKQRPLDLLERALRGRIRDARREMREDQERQRRTRGKFPFSGPDWYMDPNSTRNYYDNREKGKIQLGLAGETEDSLFSPFSYSANLDSLSTHELMHYFQDKVPWFENARTVGGGAYGGGRIDHNLAGRHIKRLLEGKFDVEDSVPDKDVRESLEESYATELPAYAMMGHHPRETARGLMGQTRGMTQRVIPTGSYPSKHQRILANLPEAAFDKHRILEALVDMDNSGTYTNSDGYQRDVTGAPMSYSHLAGLRARLGYLPPQEEWGDAITEQIIQDIGVKRMRADAKKGKGKRKDIVDFLARNENYKKTGEPMEIVWLLLKGYANHPKNPNLQEMSYHELADIAFSDDAGQPIQQHDRPFVPTKLQLDARRELEIREMETEGNMPQVYESPDIFSPEFEEIEDTVDFYEPQFTEDAKKRGAIGNSLEDDADEFEYRERIMDVREQMPGQGFVSSNDARATYEHLKETAPPELAEGFLNRYRDFVMRANTNPEYEKQKLRDFFRSLSNPEIAGSWLVNPPEEESPPTVIPKYTQEFPEGEEILDETKLEEGHSLGLPDATGFRHEWQDANKGEPMDIAFQLLKYATVRHLPNPKLIDIRRIAEQNLADNTSDPSESYSRYKKDDPRITLSGRDERKGVFLGPTGRQYETHEHRAAVDGGTLDDYDFEGYSRPYSDVKIPFPDWEKKYVPPKATVNPNVDEPHDEMFNQYYSKTLGVPMKVKSEHMEIAFQLLKERKSPEAWANKKRYDSEYQKTPKRVKYREQLNAERRKRGIYGKGGKDISHTQGGKLTLESAHNNRARHFKNRGTLRSVKKSAIGVVDGSREGRNCPSCGKPGVFRVFKPRCVYCGWEQ